MVRKYCLRTVLIQGDNHWELLGKRHYYLGTLKHPKPGSKQPNAYKTTPKPHKTTAVSISNLYITLAHQDPHDEYQHLSQSLPVSLVTKRLP